MTLVVGFLGAMMADSLSCSLSSPIGHRPTQASEDHIKIIPAPNLTPVFHDPDTGEDHTPDMIGVAGSTRAIEMFKLDPTDMLGLFGLDHFEPGYWEVGFMNYQFSDSASLSIIMRVGEKFFKVAFDGRSLEITKLRNYFVIGSGTPVFESIKTMVFNDDKVSPNELSVLIKLIIAGEEEDSVGGLFRYCPQGSTSVFASKPSITEEDRQSILKSYRRSLYQRAGHELPQEKEEGESLK